MQPKCSVSTSTATSNQQSSQQQQPINTIPSHLTPDRFKDICLRFGLDTNNSSLKDICLILEYFFDPEKQLNAINRNDVEILKQYITGGYSYETFKQKVKSYDSSSVCGLVWNINYVAYRCRTCALSPCMSICAECFKNGDHRGHDFNMFRSGAGGACDCGDPNVMNPNGFCKSHGCHKQSQLDKKTAPDELIKCSQMILSHLLYRILQFLRSSYTINSKDSTLISSRMQINAILSDVQPYFDLLNELCSLGTPIRKILVDFMIEEEFYEKKIQAEEKKSVIIYSLANNFDLISKENDDTMLEGNDKTNNNISNYSHCVYLKYFNMQQSETIKLPPKFVSKSTQICKLIKNNMLDEFLFWCIRFEFPENYVKFLLSLLPDLRYKMLFIKSFVSQYSYISVMLLNSKSEHLSSRVVHISVQLFSSEFIAIKALEECYLLPIILSTLYNMILMNESDKNEDNSQLTENSNSLLIKNKLEDASKNRHLVVDPDHSILQENLYWLVISDLVNLLSHRTLSLSFLNDSDLIDLWFELVNYFQTMNLNIRQFGEHVTQEQPTYFSSFSAELEFCSSIMWSFIQHLSTPGLIDSSKNIIHLLQQKLRAWLESIGLYDCENTTNQIIKRPNFKHLTFHLPLHRYYSTFIYNSLYLQFSKLNDLLPSNENNHQLYANILAHPLQLQIGFNEIHANMWVRNGMQMKGQAMTYVQNHFCTSFSDADLFLIQLMACKLDQNLFIDIFFERFHLKKWLKSTIKAHTTSENRITTNNTEPLRQVSSISTNSDRIIANVVEEMLDEFTNRNSNQNVTNNNLNDLYIDPDELEASHQTAMLVGSLTLLAQIIMVKPNLKLKSYSLTRDEIIYLLCVSDRTYSQVEENIPDVCSLSSAKKYIEPILASVADFLEPTLDTFSIGNLKQGRYKPKDNIWLNEYDPLYVMLRSVKRREFQESFDRYCQFIDKKFQNTTSNSNKSSKHLWPPFRLPKEEKNIIDSSQDEKLKQEYLNDMKIESNELQEKWNILNTKLLHSILFTLLYEHHYVNPISEKILYFVIYIIELAIYKSLRAKNSYQETMDYNFKFDELNYETWFKSNNFAENLCSYVSFAKLETSNEKEENSQFNYESQISTDLNHLSETLNISDENNLEYSSSSSSGLNNSPTTAPPLKKVKSCSQTSSQTNTKSAKKITNNNESILSLLVKILHSSITSLSSSTSTKSSKFTLKFLDSAEKISSSEINENDVDPFSFKNSRIGDQNDFIKNVLEMASKLNEKCRLDIKFTIDKLNNISDKSNAETNLTNDSTDISSKKSSDQNFSNEFVNMASSSGDEELKNKKLKAKARQQKLLAQMHSKQSAFLSNPNNKVEFEALNESTIDSQKSTCLSKLSSSNDNTNMEENVNFIDSKLTAPSNNSDEEKQVILTQQEEIYDCCICRLSSVSTPDRPIGVVALLQSTSVLGHRESIKKSSSVKKLPLSDDVDYKELISDTICWKQEEKRIKNMREAFTLDSCKYSINLGWRGGVYAQMCGHYLHFDCYNSYKSTLDDHLNNLRSSNMEYSCPLCRQVANCVLPVMIFSTQKKQTSSSSNEKNNESLVTSTVPNIPAKLWILSSLADKKLVDSNDSITSYKQLESNNDLNTQEKITNLLKSRPLTSQELGSKILSQCKNDALAIITLTTPIEFRYIDHISTINNPSSYSLSSPVDDDIAVFTTSVLRSQLEIDLMLKQMRDENLMLCAVNFKKKRSCFMPLFDVIATHCKLMCNETKPHVKQWIMLTNPKLSLDKTEFSSVMGTDESSKTDNLTSLNKSFLSSNDNKQEVPTLLRDPISILLMLLVNLPQNLDKNIFTNVVSNITNMVFIQSIIDLCREFDQEEREIWSNLKEDQIALNQENKNSSIQWFTFRDYVANIIKYLNNTDILKKKSSNDKQSITISNYYIKTIWTTESAKNYVETKMVHFLKIVSILKSYIYDEEVSSISMNSFDYLIKYLNINWSNTIYLSEFQYNDSQSSASTSSSNESNNLVKTAVLKHSTNKHTELIHLWLDELIEANKNHPEQLNNLLTLSYDQYHFPQFLELPSLYSDLFSYYLTKKCQFCSKVPKEAAVCLLCGAQICYKTHYCCDSMKEFNKKHINSCGAGTLILININSTYVYVIRGKRCASWASLYLDEHGEEDRDLRRGKPLYLNQQRYNLLKNSWISHTFDYQSLKWFSTSLLIY